MAFDVWKKQVYVLFKQKGKGYLIPCMNELVFHFEKGDNPQEYANFILRNT